ncbi:MAG: diacylglycerol kinase family lipid kinase [Phycisphaerae bacterium]|nr:diacylglycerol kinase family lipid kinase [Phycisphaerae bacterium]
MCGSIIIANEKARWGAGEGCVRRATEFLGGHGFRFSLLTTDRPGHARELAQRAATEGAQTVVVIGGDGTINEVVNGLLASGAEQIPRLGIVPAGSSNDLSKSLGIPQKLQQACATILNGRTRCIDVGQVGTRYFCMASSVGLFADVAAKSVKIKRLSGSVRYLAAALRVVGRMGAGWEMSVVVDGRTFQGNYGVLLVSNAPRFGGLLLSPEAKCDDGLFDCLLVEMPTKREALSLILLALRKGLRRHKKVTSFQAESLCVSLDHPAPLCNDGEVYRSDSEEIRYRILPRRLEVIC